MFDVRINLRFDVCLPLPLPRLASVTSEYPITQAQYPMSKVKRALRGAQAGRTTDHGQRTTLTIGRDDLRDCGFECVRGQR